MPEHRVIAGAVAYVDAEGMHRIAQLGDVIDFTKAEADRLFDAGALYDDKAEADAAKAEEARLAEQRAIEDQARKDEAERVAGERAAAAKATGQKAASKTE